MKLVRCLLPRLKRRNLDAVATHFGIPNHDRHRAYGDALATARVLVRLLDEAQAQGISDLDRRALPARKSPLPHAVVRRALRAKPCPRQH